LDCGSVGSGFILVLSSGVSLGYTPVFLRRVWKSSGMRGLRKQAKTGVWKWQMRWDLREGLLRSAFEES
jgi:hypothetical protein